MLPPHKTLKPMPKKIVVAKRMTPSVKAGLIDDAAEDLKEGALKLKPRVGPAPLRVLGKSGTDASA